MSFPAANYLNSNTRTEGEMKQGFEDLLAAAKQIPGAGQAKQSLTISAGAVTPAGGSAQILELDTEGAAATDDLTNIVTTNLGTNSLVLVKIANNARVVVVRHASGGTGQMSLRTGDDFTLGQTSDWILFFVNGTQLDEVARFPHELIPAVSGKTGAYTVTTADRNKLIDATSGTWTLTLPPAATAGAGFAVAVKNSGAGTITIDGNASETIDGATTQSLLRGHSYWLICDGSNWKRVGHNALTVSDARTNTVDAALVVTSTTSGVPAAGIGTGIKLQAESADENPSDVVEFDGVFSDVTAGSEDSYARVLLRVAGAALTEIYRFATTAAFKAIFTHANTADRTYTFPDASDRVVLLSSVDQLTNKSFDAAPVPTVSGAAPLYFARAWVNFNGTGVVAIRASGNVTSITDNGSGEFTVNFTTALSGSLFSTVSQHILVGNANTFNASNVYTPAVGSVRFQVRSGAGALTDCDYNMVHIFH